MLPVVILRSILEWDLEPLSWDYGTERNPKYNRSQPRKLGVNSPTPRASVQVGKHVPNGTGLVQLYSLVEHGPV